jgi:flagellar basal-body rod protein FlgC
MRGLAVAASGMHAYSRGAEVIAQNLANAETTRTPEGGPYRRQVLTFRRITRDTRALGGVQTDELVADPREGRLVYLPGHPDADTQGYVRMPNVDVTQEMGDLMVLRRLHEASVTAFNAMKGMASASLRIG